VTIPDIAAEILKVQRLLDALQSVKQDNGRYLLCRLSPEMQKQAREVLERIG
jgi:hypothetical protein